MSKKSRKQSRAMKKLSRRVKKLRGRLSKQESATAAWKRRAKRSKAEVRRLESERVEPERVEPERVESEGVESERVESKPVATAAADLSSGLPDETWTVTRLRTAARQAGVPGYSRMSKTALIDALAATAAS